MRQHASAGGFTLVLTQARTVCQRPWTRRVELPAAKGNSVSLTCIVAREYDAPLGLKSIE
ncbi:hypothetical protein [Duganella sp. Dugasp56]|uniref:hypothetical protein n=1 Tax=Duganella sp. Dugasp56 TaxID=3243046 RepID=UPI0039AECE62